MDPTAHREPSRDDEPLMQTDHTAATAAPGAAVLEAPPPKRGRGRPKGSTIRGPDLAEPLLALTLLRQRNGLTQSDLAERAGVHLSTLRRLENYPGTCSTKWQTLKKIADVLDVHPHELLARDAPKILATDPITPAATRAANPGELPARDVLDVFDVARMLHTSTKTLRTILRNRPEALPRPLPQLDRSLRWSRLIVERWLNGDPTAAGGIRRRK